ncbi:MAG: DNA polymerase III subunit beta [Solirubrobacterales bacterium]
MKFSAARTALLSELQLVTRAASTRSAIPALGGVLLSAEDGSLRLAATDTEMALTSTTSASVDQPGTMLLPARLLLDVVRVTDGDMVTLEGTADGSGASITSDRASFSVRTLPAQDFPRLPGLDPEQTATLDAAVISATVERVAKAASRDETRPVLTGILVSIEGQTLRMVATDSYRLSVKETSVTGLDDTFTANVPARALQELSRIIGDMKADTVSLSTRDNQIVFGAGDVTLSSRLIDGQFPNYRQLLPESYEHDVTLDRREFLSVVRRVSLMAQRNAPLRLRFEQGTVTLSAQTPDVGEAAESLPVNYQGEELEIGFNPQFLQDGLESVSTDEVRLRLISSLRPGLIDEASTDGTDSFFYLIMPVRLNV